MCVCVHEMETLWPFGYSVASDNEEGLPVALPAHIRNFLGGWGVGGRDTGGEKMLLELHSMQFNKAHPPPKKMCQLQANELEGKKKSKTC